MNANKDVNAQDFNMMKNVDQKYGDHMKVAKTAPKKVKEKHRVQYNHMKVEDILAMQEEEDFDFDYADEEV